MTYLLPALRISCAVKAVLISGLFAALLCVFVSAAKAQDSAASPLGERGSFLGLHTPEETAYRDLDRVTAAEGLPEEAEVTMRSDDSLLIVELVVDDSVILDRGFLVYLDDDDLLLPLGAFAELLDFPIEVSTLAGTAQGWFIREENRFALSPPYDAVQIAGQDMPIARHEIVELHEDDIYISKVLAEQWFPIRLVFNFNELRLYLSTTERLPFQDAAARRAQWDQLRRRRAPERLVMDDSVIRLPHRRFAPPNITVNHNFGASKTGQGSLHSSSHSVRLQGDFLHMDMRSGISYSASSDGDNQFQSAEFNLSKRDVEGGLLGRLNATEVEIGDTSSYSFPLAGGQQRGRGTRFSNRPANFVRDPDRFILEGYGPVGWDVEVYQDETLLEFGIIGDDGRYEFETQTLREGLNLFRIVLFGPSGERREEFERVFLGANMLEPGEFIYEVSALQSSSPLFDPSKNKAATTDPTFAVIGEYGIRENLSANLGYFTGPHGQDDLSGFGAGARASGRSMFGEINTFLNTGGGYSAGGTLTGSITRNMSWNAGHTEHRGYDPGLRTILRESFLGFSHNFTVAGKSGGSYGVSLRRRLNENGQTTTVLTKRASAGFMGFNLSNDIEYTIRNTAANDEIVGRLTVRRRMPIGNFRARMNYNLHTGADVIDSIELQFQNRLTEDIFLNALWTSRFGDNAENILSGGLDIRFEKYRLGVTGSYSDSGDVRAGLNLSYNFVPQSLKGHYQMTGDTADLSSGSLIIKPFLDLNQDGVRDENEPLLPGIAFRNMQRGREAVADEDGMLVLKGISPNQINRIMLQEKSLPDIYMKVPQKELRVLGKQGISGPIEVPVYQTGEISGVVTAYDPRFDEEMPVEELLIQLKNRKGEIVAEAYTEFDGFYVFPSLPVGVYDMFFPQSKTLDRWYVGEGTGPSFELTSEEPDYWGGDLFIAPQRIDFYENFTETERIMEHHSRAPLGAQNGSSRLGFMGLSILP